jgi:hypothetical protein
VLLVVLGVVLTLTLGGGDEPVASDRTVDSSSAPATSEDFSWWHQNAFSLG